MYGLYKKERVLGPFLYALLPKTYLMVLGDINKAITTPPDTAITVLTVPMTLPWFLVWVVCTSLTTLPNRSIEVFNLTLDGCG